MMTHVANYFREKGHSNKKRLIIDTSKRHVVCDDTKRWMRGSFFLKKDIRLWEIIYFCNLYPPKGIYKLRLAERKQRRKCRKNSPQKQAR